MRHGDLIGRIATMLTLFAGAAGLSSCVHKLDGWRAHLEVTERGVAQPLVSGELLADSSGPLLFNITVKNHEISVIDAAGEATTLAHPLKAYIKMKAGEVGALTLYRCHPEEMLICLENLGYRKVGEETVDGFLCDIYEGRATRDHVYALERIWHPKDLRGVNWLKATQTLANGRIIDGRLTGIQNDKLDPKLFEIPKDYRPLSLPENALQH